ncbi:class 1 isoprenoid biosynthesis enzyme [Roseivirga pacifica]|uniref:class 1 isoprenoid biosynthesis enzyme n=1 Tax=Roseivirga pacifica TaxID=1267423 RepID=UPI003BAEDE83
MQHTILLDLEDFKRTNEHDLTEEDFEKITFYYGLAVPVIGELYCLLRGFKISHAERTALTYLGGTTGLFDDSFDKTGTSKEHLKELINNPSLELARNTRDKLLIKFYLKALDQSPFVTRIKHAANSVFDAQVQSKKQTDIATSAQEIVDITRQKGGASILFYRAALEGEIDETEQKLLLNIGFIGQLENDLFDIYKDREDGIRTLATISKSIPALRTQYESIISETFLIIDQANFPKANKRKFALMLAAVTTRGLICLDQLEKLEHKGVFELSRYSRKQLVCNMGAPKNIMRWVVYYLLWNTKA